MTCFCKAIKPFLNFHAVRQGRSRNRTANDMRMVKSQGPLRAKAELLLVRVARSSCLTLGVDGVGQPGKLREFGQGRIPTMIIKWSVPI